MFNLRRIQYFKTKFLENGILILQLLLVSPRIYITIVAGNGTHANIQGDDNSDDEMGIQFTAKSESDRDLNGVFSYIHICIDLSFHNKSCSFVFLGHHCRCI